MTNGKVPRGGVVLGGRNYTITLEKNQQDQLRFLASAFGTGEHEMAGRILRNAIADQFARIIGATVGKALCLCAWMPVR